MRLIGNQGDLGRSTSQRRRFASGRTIFALILREMSTTYGRSPGGYLWAVLEPAGGIALLTVIFSLGFQAPALGSNFPIFYATGMVPFLLFTDVSGKVALSLLFSKPLLAYPTVTFVDAMLARFALNLLTQLMVAYAVLGGILLIFETRTLINLEVVSLGFLLGALLALGVGIANCFLFSMFPIWQRAWSVLTRPLFLISCIFFVFEGIPQPYRDYLWWNPLVHVIGIVRRGFYPSYDASYASPLYVTGLSLSLILMGLVFLRRYHRDILNT